MSDLKVYCAELGPIGTNTYFLLDEDTRDVMIIDPAGTAEELMSFLEQEECTLDGVMLTHGHHDHICALAGLREQFDNPEKRQYLRVYAAKPEQEVLMVAQYNISTSFGPGYTTHANMMINDRQVFEVTKGMHHCQCLYTPGHTLGSCCYYFKDQGMIFTGDTLFNGSIGRSDLPTGDSRKLLRSVNDILMKLPDETIVFPGHGPATTIGDERRRNPYVER